MLRVVAGCGSAIALQQANPVLELRQPEFKLVELAAGDEAEILRDRLDAHAGALAHAHSIAAPSAGDLVQAGARLVRAHAVEQGQEKLLDRGAATGLVHADASGAAAA